MSFPFKSFLFCQNSSVFVFYKHLIVIIIIIHNVLCFTLPATGAGDIVTVNTNVPPRGGGGGGGGFGGAGKPGAFGPPPPLPQGRKKWGGAAQTALNVLQQAEVVQGTTTLATTESGKDARSLGSSSQHLLQVPLLTPGTRVTRGD